MPTVKVYNMAGQQTGEMELNAAVFGIRAQRIRNACGC